MFYMQHNLGTRTNIKSKALKADTFFVEVRDQDI